MPRPNQPGEPAFRAAASRALEPSALPAGVVPTWSHSRGHPLQLRGSGQQLYSKVYSSLKENILEQVLSSKCFKVRSNCGPEEGVSPVQSCLRRRAEPLRFSPKWVGFRVGLSAGLLGAATRKPLLRLFEAPPPHPPARCPSQTSKGKKIGADLLRGGTKGPEDAPRGLVFSGLSLSTRGTSAPAPWAHTPGRGLIRKWWAGMGLALQGGVHRPGLCACWPWGVGGMVLGCLNPQGAKPVSIDPVVTNWSCCLFCLIKTIAISQQGASPVLNSSSLRTAFGHFL